MSAELDDLLRALLANPSKLDPLTPEEERALVARLRAVIGDQQPSEPAARSTSAAPGWGGEDLLTVDEVAVILRVSPRWLYRHAKNLPFGRKLSRKVLRFSRSGLARWLAPRRT